jgi:uncharacterized protein DUF6600
MSIKSYLRRTVFAAFAGLSLAGLSLASLSLASLATGATMLVAIPAAAQAQVSDEFQAALEAYGQWRQDPRWGVVWVPDGRPAGWRPYTVGHWVYTDDWGWFWVSDDDEADWGWVTYHYGRWIHDRGSWFWVPGDEWAPAWVNWRRGDSFVGWAPLPPDDIVYDYDDDPTYWTFVEPRYVVAPRLRGYFLDRQRTGAVLHSTVMVNRTFSANRQGASIAVNPGISPGVIGAASRSAIPTFRVRPRVLAGTQGVSGGVAVRPQDLRPGALGRPNAAPAIAVERTTVMIQPTASVPKPQALGKDERGRLGTNPPRAAQGGPPGGASQAPPPANAPSAPGPRPALAPPAAPPPPAAAPPSAPREERRDARPPDGAPLQTRPERPLAPQTPTPPLPPQTHQPPPPPPPPVVHQPPSPPPVIRQAPPPPPAARPVPPKPEEKKPEPPK